MNRCNVYVAGICVEVIASYLISIPQSQIVSAGYRHQKILICNTMLKRSIISDDIIGCPPPASEYHGVLLQTN